MYAPLPTFASVYHADPCLQVVEANLVSLEEKETQDELDADDGAGLRRSGGSTFKCVLALACWRWRWCVGVGVGVIGRCAGKERKNADVCEGEKTTWA